MNTHKITAVIKLQKIVLSIFLFGIASTLFAGSVEQKKNTGIKIVAHRGGTTERPENTISAFKRSVELGADIIEIDLRTSKDGHIFILHDKTLDRTTDGIGQAANFTMDELRKLDAGSWFNSSCSGERIPSFQEVLQWATKEGAVLLLDLKESGSEFAKKVAREIQKYGNEGKIIVGVHSPAQAREFSELLPASHQLGFIDSPDEIQEFALAGVDVIRLWRSWLEEEPALAGLVRRKGINLMINGTLGELDEAKILIGFSPDWILIDDPAKLRESLRELKMDLNLFDTNK